MKSILFGLFLIFSADLLALTAEPVRVVMWKNGETILGSEFIAATEGVADYLNTLPHPTEILKGTAYNCMGKVRFVDLEVRTMTSPMTYSYGDLPTVYELSDCHSAE